MFAAARAAGASDVRVASAEADDATRRAMRAAFARGDFATWNYDDAYAETASDPARLLPGARSVVCIALAYAAPREPTRPAPLRGRVAAYVGTTDYHGRVRAALAPVQALLEAAGGAGCARIACDLAPLAERAFARRAGLGWVGKHTNLIGRDGSFLVLGEIVTTLALPPDAPRRTSCGSCVRCIVACPTGALRADGTIDATRCISDLTQRTDAIPRDLRPHVGTWVWGCDICQVVCPPNRPALRATPPSADDATRTLDLSALLGLRSAEFKRRFRRGAMGWRGAAVLRRNAAVALGNALDRASVPALARALARDPHPNVRAHVAWALGRIGSPAALLALRDRGAREEDAAVLAEIARALEPFAARATLHG